MIKQLFKDMAKELVNIKKMIIRDVINDKSYSDLELVRFVDATDNRLPTKSKVCGYWLIFSKKYKKKKDTIFFATGKYDNTMGKMDVLDFWDLVICINQEKPYIELKLKTKEEVLLKIREYLTYFINNSKPLEEDRIKTETELKLIKIKENKLKNRIKEINSLLKNKK